MPTKRHIRKHRPGARDRLLTLAHRRGILRPRDLEPHRLSRETLRRLTAAGELERRGRGRSEEHTSELQSRVDLVCRLLLEKKKYRATSRQRQRRKNA